MTICWVCLIVTKRTVRWKRRRTENDEKEASMQGGASLGWMGESVRCKRRLGISDGVETPEKNEVKSIGDGAC